ncbi:MAG: DUF4089 domain-containing protein [Acidithiobacillus sp.]
MDIFLEMMGLQIDDAWRSDIKNYFLLSARMAKLLDEIPLAMTEDLAPVFKP